jgi:iron complex transport system ATP-binding protein
MLQIYNLNVGYKDKLLLEKPFSAEFPYGNFISLIGRNGSGKSTFLRQIAGLVKTAKNTLFIEDKDYADFSRLELAKKISWAGTDNRTFESLSVFEFVALGRHPYLDWGGFLTQFDKDIIENSIQKLNIGNLSGKFLSACSDGEKQSALMARILAQNTNVVLLDEITAHLDFVHRKKSFELLKLLSKKENKLIILATHEIDLSLKFSDEILLFHNKNIQRFKTSDPERSEILSSVFEGFS